MNRHVGLRALNALAFVESWGCNVVEAADPSRAVVCRKRPLADPDVILDLLSRLHGACILIAVGLNVVMREPEEHVLVRIYNNILMIIVGEQPVPKKMVEVEGIVEDKLEAGLLLFHHGTDIPVEAK